MAREWNFARLVVLFAVIVTAISANGLAGASGLAANQIVRLDILTVNDFHGALAEEGNNPGAAKLVGYLKGEVAKNPRGTIILSSGDMFQGSVDSNLLYGKPVVDVMNEAGFTAMVLGNHEFDWGMAVLIERIKQSRFAYLAANVIDKSTGSPPDFVKPYILVERMGLKIGIIGIVTPETAYKANPKIVAPYQFSDPRQTVEKYAAALRKQGAAIVIVLSHLGCEQDQVTREISGEAAELAMAAKGVDVLVTGHSHQAIAGKINGVAVVQAGYNGRAVGKVSIAYSKNEQEIMAIAEKVSALNSVDVQPDPAVKAILDKAQAEVAPVKNVLLGNAVRPLNHDRNKLSALGQWSSDAMRAAAGADIAFQHGGGLRTSLPAGPITIGMFYEAMPFDNTLVTLDMTGQQIMKVLEYGIKNPKIGMIQYSGIKVKYDGGMPEGQRVVEVTMLDDQPLRLDKNYRVVTNDFLAAGGDGYTMFAESGNAVDTFTPVRDVLVNAVRTAGKIEFTLDNRFMEVWSDKVIQPTAA